MSKFNKLLVGAGVIALSISAANAGVLTGKLADINTNGNVNTQKDNQLDDNTVVTNGSNDFGIGNGLLDTETNEATVEDGPVNLTSNRLFGLVGGFDKFASGHFEYLIFDNAGEATITGDTPIDVEIDLDHAFWKQVKSAGALVRAGTDEIFSEVAEGFNGLQTQIGNDEYRLFLTGDEGSEASIGFILPVRIDECTTSSVSAVLKTPSGPTVSTRQVVDESSQTTATTLATCDPDRDSITSVLTLFDVEVDVGSEADFFAQFLEPGGIDDKGRDPVTMTEFGMVTLNITNDVFDLKSRENTGSARELRFVNIDDIESFTLSLEFESLQGIEGLQLLAGSSGTTPCTLDSGTEFSISGNVLTATITGSSAVAACFGITESSSSAILSEGNMQQGLARLKILAETNTSSSNYGNIMAQQVSLVDYKIAFDNTQANIDNNNMFQDEINFLGQDGNQDVNPDDVFRIVRQGLAFGPFDWVTGPDRTVSSVFRFSGFPQDGAASVDAVKGFVIFENSESGDNNGRCLFDLSEYGMVDGETVLSRTELLDVVSDPDCLIDRGSGLVNGPLGDGRFRADVTWTFFCGVDTCSEADVDRLLQASNGTLADYGDNGNDANSFKARSCDPGRFGPHVFNTLNSEQSDALLELCRPDDGDLIQ